MWPPTRCLPWRYTRLDGALVVVSADDPGMASSQNEQDNRRYALAAGVPMLEPSDSQEAYEFTLRAIEISERWQCPVLLRMTTRVCHSKDHRPARNGEDCRPRSRRTSSMILPPRVMIPAYAKPAHRRLRKRLAEIAAWNDAEGPESARSRLVFAWASSLPAWPSNMCARPLQRPAC